MTPQHNHFTCIYTLTSNITHLTLYETGITYSGILQHTPMYYNVSDWAYMYYANEKYN